MYVYAHVHSYHSFPITRTGLQHNSFPIIRAGYNMARSQSLELGYSTIHSQSSGLGVAGVKWGCSKGNTGVWQGKMEAWQDIDRASTIILETEYKECTYTRTQTRCIHAHRHAAYTRTQTRTHTHTHTHTPLARTPAYFRLDQWCVNKW